MWAKNASIQRWKQICTLKYENHKWEKRVWAEFYFTWAEYVHLWFGIFRAKRTDEETLPHKNFRCLFSFRLRQLPLFFCRGEKCGVPCSMFTEPLTEYIYTHSFTHSFTFGHIHQRKYITGVYIYIHFVIVKRRIAERKSWCKWVIRASCDTVVKNHEKKKTNGLANVHTKEKKKKNKRIERNKSENLWCAI